jgi:ribonuclease/clavin/mitogillin
MTERPLRIVTDSMIGVRMPDIDRWSTRVTVVLGQNPGVFTGPGTNTFIIGTGPRPVLLDTGHGVSAYLPLLERALRDECQARSLSEIVVTHAHPDHIGGIDGVRQQFGRLPVRKKPWPGRDPIEDVHPIDDGAELAIEGATLRAVWTPGHARDHLCFYLVEERALFSGDVVLGAGTTVIPADGDLGDYMASLHRLLGLDIAVIYPAHGPAIHNPREKITSYIAHRELREQQILDALRAGPLAVPQLVEQIYRDVPAFLHTAAALSVAAHLRKLERDGAVTREAERWSRR